MTPKEKAKELVNQFEAATWATITEAYNPEEVLELSKQCALIAVEEILKGDHLLRMPLSYWEEVKIEIGKL